MILEADTGELASVSWPSTYTPLFSRSMLRGMQGCWAEGEYWALENEGRD